MTYNITPLFSTPIYSQDTDFKFFEKEKEFVNSLRYVEQESGCMLSRDQYIFRHKNLNRIKIECENHLKVYTKKVLCINQNFYITNSWITKKEFMEKSTLVDYGYGPRAVVSPSQMRPFIEILRNSSKNFS